MPQTREERLLKLKEWRDKNKEHRAQYKKDNRERDNQIRRALRKSRKEEEYNKNHEYYILNKERICQRSTDYLKTENGIKSRMIRGWKKCGIKDGDYESLYEYYLSESECPICNHNFSKYNKVLDHDHKTGEIRMVLCQMCNLTEFQNIKKTSL